MAPRRSPRLYPLVQEAEEGGLTARQKGSPFEFSGLTKGYPLIDLWMKTNAAFLAGRGETEVGLFRSNVMAFLTGAQRAKLEAELQDLQRYREMKRMRALSLLGPDVEVGDLAFIWRKWLFEYLRIVLKHADIADLFQTERIGGF